MNGLPPDFSTVVKANKANTLGWVIASSEPCLSVQDEESKKIKRRLKPVAPKDLTAIELPASWLAAVLLCPGDDTDAVASWARQLPRAQLERIRFYCHPEVDLYEAFAGWRKAELPDPVTKELSEMSLKAFHKTFGLDLNIRIYRDAA